MGRTCLYLAFSNSHLFQILWNQFSPFCQLSKCLDCLITPPQGSQTFKEVILYFYEWNLRFIRKVYLIPLGKFNHVKRKVICQLNLVPPAASDLPSNAKTFPTTSFSYFFQTLNPMEDTFLPSRHACLTLHLQSRTTCSPGHPIFKPKWFNPSCSSIGIYYSVTGRSTMLLAICG